MSHCYRHTVQRNVVLLYVLRKKCVMMWDSREMSEETLLVQYRGERGPGP